MNIQPDKCGGALARTAGPDQERYYWIARGRRHPIMDYSLFDGSHWPGLAQATDIDAALLDCFNGGRPIYRTYSDEERADPPRDSSLTMRAIACSFLSGQGIEFGAGANPLPIPADCTVRYADVMSYSELLDNRYPGQSPGDIIEPQLSDSLDDMSSIPDESVDFIAAAHVIEHVQNPIGAVASAWRKLRPSGRLLLVVPDMLRTFDRTRALTPLDHLVEDFVQPDRLRDAQHFQEFYRLAIPADPANYESAWKSAWIRKDPIHYHTFTHASFQALVSFVMEELGLFAAVWSQNTLPHEEYDNENYFVLTK